MSNSDQSMLKVFDAIHDEALRLLNLDVNRDYETKNGLNLIVSLARYRHDVGSAEEIRGNSVNP